MRRWQLTLGVAAAAFGAGVAVAASGEPPAEQAAPACAATRVHGSAVRAGPFRGELTPEYDVVGGRFRLHVGGYRDRETGLTQKIPWFARRGAPVGRRLRLTGTRLGPHPRRFTQVFQRASGSDSGATPVFPSIVSPPAKGCWRLHLRSGDSSARLTVLVTTAG